MISSRISLWVGGTLSVALHAAAVVTLRDRGDDWTPAAVAPGREVLLIPPPPQPEAAPEVPKPEPEPPAPPVDRLGIRESEQQSKAWLGFADPTPHQGPLADFDQSAMSPAPGIPAPPGDPGPPGAPVPPAPTAASSPAPDVQTDVRTPPRTPPQAPPPAAAPPPAPPAIVPPPAPPATPDESGDLPTPAPKPESEPAPNQDPPRDGGPPRPDNPEAPPEERPEPAEEPTPQAEPIEPPAEDVPVREAGARDGPRESTSEDGIAPDPTDRPEPDARPPERAEPDRVEPVPGEAPPADASKSETSPAPETPALPQGVAAPTLPAAGDRPGERSDRESDAASRERPVNVRAINGRVAAGEGLELRTVRPRWSTTTLLTTSPKNPVVRVRFGRDGRVKAADFVDGFSTGYPDVDAPLMDAIFRWRASGKRIEELPTTEAAGVTIVLRITLR